MSRVIVLSGAGISAESGISTFRDSGGLWDNYNIEDVCYYNSLEKNRELVLDFYDKRRLELSNVQANYAHKKVAELKNRYKNDIAVITQNVDDLFERAGCEEVIHLHGFLTNIKCPSCDYIKPIGYTKQDKKQRCVKCDTLLRPDIIFFGEMAPMYELLDFHIRDCEFLVVIGSSGNVINSDMLAGYCDNSILNNLEPSDAIDESYYKKVLYKKATEAIDEIVLDIENFLS